MPKKVALESDVEDKAGGVLADDVGKQGSWKLDDLNVELGDSISVNGEKVALSATVRCTYQGGTKDSNGTPLEKTEELELTAGTTKLTDGGRGVLVDGDQITSTYGNQIKVSVRQALLTTD